MIFVTSDTHFGHKNIIKYSNRPFESVAEMDAEMVKRWNRLVSKNDEVYHLGDFSFSNAARTYEIINQLNGRIHLLWGNHDKTIQKNKELQKMFVWCKNYHELKFNKETFVLFHYPLYTWNKMHHGSYHLFGHVHGDTEARGGRSMDVGVDCHNFTPVPLEMIVDVLSNQEILNHHNRNTH